MHLGAFSRLVCQPDALEQCLESRMVSHLIETRALPQYNNVLLACRRSCFEPVHCFFCSPKREQEPGNREVPVLPPGGAHQGRQFGFGLLRLAECDVDLAAVHVEVRGQE